MNLYILVIAVGLSVIIKSQNSPWLRTQVVAIWGNGSL
jgi:hypothetical protein